jgi:phosphoribosylanthranilate isomerase
MESLTTPPPRIKICCIASVDEARLAIRYGASAIGLVSAMPSGPGPIDEELIAEIVRHVPPGVATFLLTCKTDSISIIDQQRRTRANTIQLVDSVAPSVYPDLRAALPGIKLVQVIHVRDDDSVDEAIVASQHVDALLLDSGNPSLPIKELGGTGRIHDWDISRRIRESVAVPLFLAGGLNATNVAEATRRVQPFGIDVCSGVRTAGNLDESKLRDFMTAVARAEPLTGL